MISFSGHLRLRAARRENGRTALAEQAFRAPFHLSKPYWDTDAETLLVQVVNPTAGILAGDRLESEVAVETEAALMVTTPSASRVFMMRDGAAECRQRFTVAKGAWLEVSPEPLVPHRGSDYHQSTEVVVECGGSLLFVDQLLPGRIGHGECWAWSNLCLALSIQVGGELVLQERFAHSGAELRELAEFFGSGETACFANAVLIAPNDADASWRPELAALHSEEVWVGVSALRQSGWSIKIVARDALRLRDSLRAVRTVLARSFPRLTCDSRKL